MLNSLEGVYVTKATAKCRHIEQVEVPCTVGILVLIAACVCIFLDRFASDKIHELVK